MEIASRIMLILGLLLNSSISLAGWTYLYSEPGDGNAIIDVSMANERVGCAVGVHKPGGSASNSEPLILCTSDGGGSWRNVKLGSGLFIPSSVFLLDESTGYVGAMKISGFQTNTKIYRTVDGISWSELALPADAKGLVNDLFFADSEHGWAATEDGLLRTNDGGENWTWSALPELGEDRFIEGVFFADTQKGWAVGGQAYQEGDEWTDPVEACCGFILGTIDGGATWSFVENDLPGELHRIAFSGQLGLAVGGGADTGLLMRTEDGGTSWNTVSIPAGQYGAADYLTDVAWDGADKAWATGNIGDGNPMVLTSSDSAATWTIDESYQDAFDGLSGFEAFVKYSMLTALSFPGEGMGMISGKNALLVGYLGEGFCPDMDGDGHQDEACGGDDCDDQNQYISPSAEELCNGLDENCDGIPDETFDLNTDHANCGECGFGCQPAQVCWDGHCTMDCPDGLIRCDQDCADTTSSVDHCGGCDNHCSFDHAGASCVDGTCIMGECDDGWMDLDGEEGNGCEYFCVPSEPATETCNGLDDDCNGLVDDGLACENQADGGTDGGTDGEMSQGDGGVDTESDVEPQSSGCGCSTGGTFGGSTFLVLLFMMFLSTRKNQNG